MRDGSLGFKCFHNSCSAYTWHDFRAKFDPQAYSNSVFRTNQMPAPKTKGNADSVPATPHTPAMLDIASVEDYDRSKIVTIRSRFEKLDKLIGGFNKGELSIWSGANSSGKSTYLKTVALAVLMAQSICTVLAERYEAAAFRIYTSMALRDDLLAGESYYIVETKSLKRILDAAEEASPILCVVDEVLRGTNTVERIAASSEVLRAMADDGLLCLAATHDIELCELLQDCFDLYHFEEQVGENEMLFDYVIRPGKASSRNAINLLQLMGFDRHIVDRAHQKANRYLETGEWRA